MIHGLIVFDKPKMITSHAVVEKIRVLFPGQKVGHFGTLDPLAEGVLLVGVGNATKFSNFYMKKKKHYAGRIKFGFATSTYDKEGCPVSEKKEINLETIDIDSLLSRFTGEIQQVPPIYSAKKLDGKPLYKYAREKRKVRIAPITVEVYSLKGKVAGKDLLDFEALTSSGTYIRSLAHDIGQRVGVGAYLEYLKRVKVGEFGLQNAVTVEEIEEAIDESALSKIVLPIESLLPEFPKIIVNQNGRRGVLNGMPLRTGDIIRILTTAASPVEAKKRGLDLHYRLFDEEGQFLAVARKDDERKQFKPFIVFPGR